MLIHPGGDRLCVLNAAARVVWEGWADGLETDAIAGRLAARFGLTPRRAHSDVVSTLRGWQDQELTAGSARYEVLKRPPPLAATVPADADDGLAYTYRFYDTALQISFGDVDLARRLHALLCHLAADAPKVHGVFSVLRGASGFRLLQDGVARWEGADADELIHQVLYHVIELGYQPLDWLAVLHAAAVADGDAGLILAGGGGSGKTTLTAALLRSGLTYLGDDVVPLDRRTRDIIPVPAGLCLKEGSWAVLASYYPGLVELPVHRRLGQAVRYLVPAKPPTWRMVPARSLVFPCYGADAETRLIPLSATAALQKLIESETLLRRPLAQETVSDLIAWLDALPAYSLSYSRLGEAVTRVQGLVQS